MKIKKGSTLADAGRALPQTVLREATDRRLLDETIRRGRTTRAELAEVTGYSRPTVSEAVRRLVSHGLLDAIGLKETGKRGRIGTFYALGARAGWVLGLEISQSGVRARAADLAGNGLREAMHQPTAPGDEASLVASVRRMVQTMGAAGTTADPSGPLRAIGVSVANPVDPDSHSVVPLVGTPFPEGLLSPAAMIQDMTSSPVLVDNDVNLAALAEHRLGHGGGESSFAYVYIGAGMGVGLYVNGQLIRGAHGLAGEIGFLPGIVAATLSGELQAGGFGRQDAPSTDVGAVLALLDRPSSPEADQLAEAVGRAIVSVAAVVDPALFLLGGPVGQHPALLPKVRERLLFPGPTRLTHGALGNDAPLLGALQMAVEHARATAITP